MQLIFNKVTMHNFLSFGHAEIELKDKQYCLIEGFNNCKLDNATSNGSGKSTISSAICWALTGETIQGIKSNLKNKWVDEKLAYVELNFSADSNNYTVKRFIEPKSDLKIILDGNDISGKGIRESELILAQHLPDLTANLIASIIILGQGLPSKFSSNSPSGRKEVLEKLSKSDFMIEDIKNRIAKRSQELSEDKRKVDDAILSASSQKQVYEKQIAAKKYELEELNKPHDFDTTIENYNTEINTLKAQIESHTSLLEDLNNKNAIENTNYGNKLAEKNNVLLEDNNQFNEFKNEYFNKRAYYNSEINTISNRITAAKNIKDVCPTCGRPFLDVKKPDTSADEALLAEKKAELTRLENIYNAKNKEHQTRVNDLSREYDKDISEITNNIRKIKDSINNYTNENRVKNNKLMELQTALQKTLLDKENHENKIKAAEQALSDLESSVQKLDELLLYNNNEKQSLESHISVINQIQTLVKRDFRGFLLGNVISYISSKAKEYSTDIFGTDQLDFVLDGNNIDISYCQKAFENLSGGEKQKVDLIIQFAIRDMMQQYLGFSSNIIILDEIFDALDASGCGRVIELISQKLKDIESVFIISHRADELAIPYDTRMIVIKDENGVSRIK